MTKKKAAKPRTKKKPAPSIADAIAPPTYEELVAQIAREHPDYTRQQIEAAIRDAQEAKGA